MTKTRTVIATGLTGVGKTSVITEATKDIESYSYGSLLLEKGKERGLVENRDDITELPPEEYDELQEITAERISAIVRNAGTEAVVIDTHATLDTPTGYRPGFTKRDLSIIEPDQFVFIDASPEEIIERRQTDDSRNRDTGSVDELSEQRDASLRTLTTFSVETRAPVAIIENADGELESAVSEFNSLL